MSGKAEVMKQYMNLVKTIKSFSDGQASLSENQPDDDSMELVNVTICPNGGMYKNGKFEFEIDISDGYPEVNPPRIRCLTKVYHPNIDQVDDYSEGDICLNLLDELWTPELTLEDYVQGLLFMFYNPNVEDPLNPAFCGDEDDDVMRYNVRMSMRGKEVDGTEYDNVLPDGYESEDGETYDEEYDANAKRKTKDALTTANDDDDASSDGSITGDEEQDPENKDKPEECSRTLSTIIEVDETTGQEMPVVGSKPVSDLMAVISRILRFLRPSSSLSLLENDSSLALRSRLGSVIICSVAILTFRFGLRIFLRTPLINVVR